MRYRLAIVALALLLGGWGPLFIFPGGELSGTDSPPPDSWAFTDAIDTVQLETRPADPYSVNIWITRVEASVYIHAGANRASWVEHIEADPRVRVQAGERIFPLRAIRVRDVAEFARFSDAYERKYDRRPRNENVEEVWLFRLTPRD